LIIVSFVVFGISFAKAAPGPWGIALNTETKECAGFWPGDEFVAYNLPDGWKAYFPKYDPESGETSLETEIGNCDFKRKGDEEKCCQQLGYKYISDNIGAGQKTILRDREEFKKELTQKRKTSYLIPIISLAIIAGFFILIIWLIRKKEGNKTD
jgi:hypothetical protein